MKIAVLQLSAFLATAVQALKMEGYLDKADIPSTGRDWVTLDNGVEFQPGPDMDPRLDQVRRLWGGSVFGKQPPLQTIYTDATERYFDEYAQAWRAIGWYTDCDYCSGVNADAEICAEDENGDVSGCPRFLLWAAYVDLDYAGGAGNEYQYYNRHSGKWTKDACKQGKRCVKMDCHEPNSNFALVGFFKEPNYDAWMEQLQSYQADCVLDDSERATMQKVNPYALVNTCTRTTTLTSKGYYLFYNLKPSTYGTVDIGLYLDSSCSMEYQGSDVSLADVIYEMTGNKQYNYYNNNAEEEEPEENEVAGYVLKLVENIESWNEAFAAFKFCQPCKIYDLTKFVAKSQAGASGNRYYQNVECDENGDCQENNDGNDFQCAYDYDELNQCMLFRENTNMLTASFKDVEHAGNEATITSINVAHYSYGQPESAMKSAKARAILSWIFLFVSSALFGYAVARIVKARRLLKQQELAAPLVAYNNGESA